ncbi:UNVERIFIED_CONTAM: Sodium-dependent noradrenaline transporter [Trichonephila clavipes]
MSRLKRLPVIEGGQYILEMMDKYGGGTAVVCVAVVESMAIAWMYGVDRFCEDIKFMLGTKPGIYWRITWKVTAPAILTVGKILLRLVLYISVLLWRHKLKIVCRQATPCRVRILFISIF